MAQAAARKFENFLMKKIANSAFVVLAHLCHQKDSDFYSPDDDEDVSVFQRLINSIEKVTDSKDAETLTVEIASDTSDSQKFEGVCVDSEAQLSVVGKRQADLYCQIFRGGGGEEEGDESYQFKSNLSVCAVI